ncbi:MAG: hypothetical protein Q9P14_16125 [candidate division KSB1 bacterium]|nr:hypothetical protein [candidate division KSB1 bacterium]
MKVGIPKEVTSGETRVAVEAADAAKSCPVCTQCLDTKLAWGWRLSTGPSSRRGSLSGGSGAEDSSQGAGDLYASADAILKVRPLTEHPQLKKRLEVIQGARRNNSTTGHFMAPCCPTWTSFKKNFMSERNVTACR